MEKNMTKHFDLASLIVILITFVLFTVALFVKGFTQDLLLEAGVLLVSIKLIMMAYKNNTDAKEIRQELGEIKQMLADAGNGSRE
jgi:hypothetical protein